MRKIILSLILAMGLVVGWGIVGDVRVSAQWCDCTQWECYFTTNPETGGTSQICGCVEGSQCAAYCGPGQYVCNNGCCDIGSGEPAPTCFPAGTKITMADGSRKNIEEVRVGERVMSQSAGGARSSSRVERLIRPVSDNMCRIEFEDGESLKVTKSHPFLTDDGWKAIDEEAAREEEPGVEVSRLEKGDALYREDGSRARVREIACWSERVQVYNFTVDNDHTYFAEGYLAHNKGAVPTDCRAPKNCPNNNSCVPTATNNCANDRCTPPGSYACYPYNIDTIQGNLNCLTL